MESNLGIILGMLCGGLFLLAFAAGGAYLIYSSLKSRKKAEASRNWPAASGVVRSVKVSEQTSTDSEGDSSTSYTPRVEYDYSVNGVLYRGKKLAFGAEKGYASEKAAWAALAAYPEGASVTVYYDPANPGEAVLQQKAVAATAGLVIGIILVLVAVCGGCGGLGALAWNFF